VPVCVDINSRTVSLTLLPYSPHLCSVRGLQPVSRIYTPANQGPDSLDLHLPPPVLGPVTIKLQAGMTMLQELLPFNELL
jgi:hypothetical protein